MPRLGVTGRLTMLRVHDVGTGYGPDTDKIDVEVVIRLDSTDTAGKAFGFQLRNDANRPARQGMLDLLRDAYANNWPVRIDYDVASTTRKNGILVRAWVTRP